MLMKFLVFSPAYRNVFNNIRLIFCPRAYRFFANILHQHEISQLKFSHLKCYFLFQNLDKKYKNFPKLIETMENIIECQVRKAETENEIQIKRYFNQEKEYINTGHKNFKINIERKSQAPEVPPELNILDFKGKPEERKIFYNSKSLIQNMWEDDAIILEGCLKHLQIVQDSLSDKLPKIIHYEIFYSTTTFIEQELSDALLDEWKRNKDSMFSDESQREQKKKLENDIANNKNALEIVTGMTRLIKNFQSQS